MCGSCTAAACDWSTAAECLSIRTNVADNECRTPPPAAAAAAAAVLELSRVDDDATDEDEMDNDVMRLLMMNTATDTAKMMMIKNLL